LSFHGFVDDPEKDTHTGLHHAAFEYASFEDLNTSYLRLREAGISPEFCLDHGPTFSYYYSDPDGNYVELQCDNFGDWTKSREWIRTSAQFHSNPIGVFVDPEKVATAADAGERFAEIHRRALAGEFAPAQPPIDVPASGSERES
jgi:catechol 2,3-dioxygenase